MTQPAIESLSQGDELSLFAGAGTDDAMAAGLRGMPHATLS